MDAKEMFFRCLDQATHVICQTWPVDYAKPTPDDEWDVKDLVHHMLYELSWGEDLAAGKTLEQVNGKHGGNLLAGGLHKTWNAKAERVHKVVNRTELNARVHVSYGEISLEDYLRQLGTDLLIHSWDLSEGIGKTIEFEKQILDEAHHYLKSVQKEMSASGLFKPSIDLPPGSSQQEKVLGLTGRRAV